MNPVKRPGNIGLIRIRQESGGMENSFSEILENQETEGNSCIGKEVCSSNKQQVKTGVLNSRGHLFAFDLLEIEFGENVEPVSNLHNVEKFEHEGHLAVRIAFPKLFDAVINKTEYIYTHASYYNLCH